MDELGLNKLFAGILVAGLMLMAGIKLADVLVPHSELTQNAYVIEVPEGGTAVAEAPKATGPEPIFALLASADALAGEKLAKKCTACHVFDQGGANKVGPRCGTSSTPKRARSTASPILVRWLILAASGTTRRSTHSCTSPKPISRVRR